MSLHEPIGAMGVDRPPVWAAAVDAVMKLSEYVLTLAVVAVLMALHVLASTPAA
jgi:hypothetical protein